MVQMMTDSLEVENKKLMERLSAKLEAEVGGKEQKLETQAMSQHISELQDQLSSKQQKD
jgi:regulator of replication initiation timing